MTSIYSETNGLRQQYDVWVQTNWQNMADALCDYASDPDVGQMGTYADATLFDQRLHPTGGAYMLMATRWAIPAIQSIPLPAVILSMPQITGGSTNFTFQVCGPSGSNYVLQVSTNLLNWSPVSTSAIPVSGTITVSNAISGYSNRFYRAYLQ